MSKESKAIIFCTLIVIIQITSASAANIDQASSSPSSNTDGFFSANLLGLVAKTTTTTQNVVFCPMSVETALAMTYLGAAGKTAEELRNSLGYSSTDKDKIGEYYARLLKNASANNMSIVNRMFVSSNYPLQADFNRRAEKYFNSGAEALNFKDSPSKAIKAINTWVENKTNKTITNLMTPGSVDGDTVALIVNAIHFKGKWELPFSQDLTRKSHFWVSQNESIDVDCMIGSDRYVKYGEFPELQATAIELPYEDSDLSMMLLLPSEKDGWADLKGKLGSISLTELSSKMTPQEVDLIIPKFKIEFAVGLSDHLKAMGIRSMFENADLPGIFQSGGRNVKLSDVKQKAFIDVNEAGSEAAAASFIELTFMILNTNPTTFNVDRPFFFAIKDSNKIYFAGNVAKP